jgi:hypothetical protein
MTDKTKGKPAKVRLVNREGGEAHVSPDQVEAWLAADLGWMVAK